MDLNLDTLKQEITDYLESSGLAVFHGNPGGLEGQPMVLWDSAKFPDYRMFVEVAQKAGAKVIIFGSAEFETSDLDELAEQLTECEVPRDERRNLESRLRDLRIYEGLTCTLELGFSHDGRIYVWEVQPDWYDDFLNLEDEIAASMAGDDDEYDEGNSLGGYYSKN